MTGVLLTHSGTAASVTQDAQVANKAYVDWSLVQLGWTEAPKDGQTYGRNNGAWAIVSGIHFDTVSAASEAVIATSINAV